MSISANNLSFAYGSRGRTGSPVVRDVSIDIGPGMRVGILGPNGSGKTTLLKLLAGVLTPQRGEVLLDGVPMRSLARRAIARRVAMVPQDTHPAFDYTVLELTLMGRYPHLGAFEVEGAADVDIARQALTMTGTVQFAPRLFSTLSGGERQRVVIASALAQQAGMLLLDEPTASLDPGYQLEIAELLRWLNRDRHISLVLATHDLNLAAGVCETLVLLNRGSVVAAGPTADVLTPERIASLYGIDADVTLHQRAGHLVVVPVRRRTT